MITEPDEFFAKGCGRCGRFGTADCSAQLWNEGVSFLRRLCLEAGLQEMAKWGHPCYVHAGRNIAIIGAFRSDFRLTFFNAALMKDPEGLLEKAGPNTQHAGVMRFEDVAQLKRRASIVSAYLNEAMDYAERGLMPKKNRATFELPDELIEALDADPELAAAFDGLTPGRQRSYVINLHGAKASATRVRRIEKFRAKILAGKGANER